MKKVLLVLFVAVFVLSACAPAVPATEAPAAEAPAAEAPAAEAPAAEAPAVVDACAPEALADVPAAFVGRTTPIKVAVVRNLPSDDHTKQFLAGATTMGESLGMVVDTFIADNDDAKFQELVAQAIEKGYDGLIISHGKKDYCHYYLLHQIIIFSHVISMEIKHR